MRILFCTAVFVIFIFVGVVLDEVERGLVDQVQWHDMGAAALEVHVSILHCGLMSASVGVLDHEL